jgi:hypothetical protein
MLKRKDLLMKAHNRRIPLILSAGWALAAIATFANLAYEGFRSTDGIMIGLVFLALCIIFLHLALRP